MEVGLFYTMGIVFRADVITHLIEQFPGVVPFHGLTPLFDRAAVVLYSIEARYIGGDNSGLTQDYAAGLLEACEPPCLSLYQPTHRHHPENQQDPIRFRNLVKVLEESLLQRYPTDEIRPLLDPFLALADDRDFWNHTLDGLAVLGARDKSRVY